MAWSSFSNDWIAVLRPAASPRVRLLCFPHAGGAAYAFQAWPGYLPPDVEVCALQLPGRGCRLLEAPMTRVDQVMEPLWEAFQPFLQAPVAFFGHSLGALIAFEFARQLQARNIPLAHLFVAGATAPQLPYPEPPIRHLPDREFMAEVRQRYEALPEEILRDEKMVAVFLPALRADFTMAETYQIFDGPLLECGISAFGGDQDGSVAVHELAAWRERTGSTFKFSMFPGGHFFVDSARESVIKVVAAGLERSLRGNAAESSIENNVGSDRRP